MGLPLLSRGPSHARRKIPTGCGAGADASASAQARERERERGCERVSVDACGCVRECASGRAVRTGFVIRMQRGVID